MTGDEEARGRGLDAEQWRAVFEVVLDELRASAGRDAAKLPQPVPSDDAEHVANEPGEGCLICEEGR
jgi:hypothetical protein